MLLLCANRFDIEEEQLAFTRDYKTEYEQDLQQEDTAEPISQYSVEISDNEDEEVLSAHSAKRRRESSTDHEAEDGSSSQRSRSEEIEPQLPSQLNTQRVSGRHRIPSIRLQGYSS